MMLKLMCVVAGYWIIVRRAPLEGPKTAIRASVVIKCAVSITPHSYIRFAVPVIVVLSIDVRTCQAKDVRDHAAVAAAQDVPSKIGRRGRTFANDRKIGLAVAVVITGDDEIVAPAPRLSDNSAIAASQSIEYR